MAIEEKKFLGTEGVQQLITNIREEYAEADAAVLAESKQFAQDLGENYDAAGVAATKVQELADGQVKTNTEAIAKLNGDASTDGSVAKAVADAKALVDADVEALEEKVDKNTAAIGTMENLDTTAKGNLVEALNEVRNAVSAGGTAAAVTMEEVSTGLAEGVLKAYTIKQGENTVGTINIPKDMVVQSGDVVTDPEGQPAGTYIKLVLANATNDIIYVNVGTLVDIYKAKASAPQVQIAIDSATREISASIVAGSITATELAANAVVTAKIADGNVTKAKLSAEVQASLDKADVAEQNAKTYADGLNTAMDTRVKAVEEKAHTHANAAELDKVAEGDVAKWNAAQANAEATAAADATAKANKALEDAKTDASNKDAVVLAEAQKASAAVQTALDTHTGNGDIHVSADDKAKWNGALQTSDIATGSENGTIAVKGVDVAVKGLGSAAYAETTAFDASGSAAQALTDAKAHTDATFEKFVEISAAEIDALFV